MNSLYEFWEGRFQFGYTKYLYYAGVILLLLYALSKVAFYSFFKVFEPIFIIVGLYIFFRFGTYERKTLPVMLLVASVLVAFVVWFFGVQNHPELIRNSPKLEHLARHFIFIIIAYWLAGNVKNNLIYFSFALVGLLFAPWSQGGGLSEILHGLAGRRIDFGLQNAQHTGMLFGVAIIGLLVFYGRFFSVARYRYFFMAFWFLALLFCVFVVFATQTRSAIIGLLLLAPFLLVVFARKVIRRYRLTMLPMALFFVLFVIFLVFLFPSDVQNRVKSEYHVVESFLDHGLDSVPFSSFGARLHSWNAGLEWVYERPVLGWGSNGGAIVNRNSEKLAGTRSETWGHMHSSYFEMLVRYGLLGVSIYALLFIWVAYKSFCVWSRGGIENDFYLFYLCFFIFFAFVNLFESYMFYYTGVYIFNLVLGSVVSFIWASNSDVNLKNS